MEKLENKLQNHPQQKPDWKQWVPVFGYFKTIVDLAKNKPTVVDPFYDNIKKEDRLSKAMVRNLFSPPSVYILYQGTPFF